MSSETPRAAGESANDTDECDALSPVVIDALAWSVDVRGIHVTALDVDLSKGTVRGVIRNRGAGTRRMTRRKLLRWYAGRMDKELQPSMPGPDDASAGDVWKAVLDALARSVAHKGLRPTAREVGLRAPTLRAVIANDHPGQRIFRKTRAALLLWYAKQGTTRVPETMWISADLLSGATRDASVRARLRTLLLNVALDASPALLNRLERIVPRRISPSGEEPS